MTEENKEQKNEEVKKEITPPTDSIPSKTESSKKDKKETPKVTLDRTYTIPLKKAFLKAPRHERARIAVREIKRFLARNMKIRDRDLDKIKLDTYFNNHIWSRGKTNPPTKVKVQASKIDGIVRVNFLEIPESVKFTKAKNDRRHIKSDQKPVIKSTDKPSDEEKKTDEEKKDEKEKEQSVAELREKQQEQKAKAEKHTAKVSKDKSATSQRQVLSRH